MICRHRRKTIAINVHVKAITLTSLTFSDGVGQSEIGGSDASLSVMLSHEESMLTELSRLWKM